MLYLQKENAFKIPFILLELRTQAFSYAIGVHGIDYMIPCPFLCSWCNQQKIRGMRQR